MEAWLRGVKAWQMVTRVPAKQQGVALLSCLSGDARAIAAEVEVEVLASELVASSIVAVAQEAYAWVQLSNPVM
eukprot:5598392-Amphidinium_carterae.1